MYFIGTKFSTRCVAFRSIHRYISWSYLFKCGCVESRNEKIYRVHASARGWAAGRSVLSLCNFLARMTSPDRASPSTRTVPHLTRRHSCQSGPSQPFDDRRLRQCSRATSRYVTAPKINQSPRCAGIRRGHQPHMTGETHQSSKITSYYERQTPDMT
jgi:hypothetical protein